MTELSNEQKIEVLNFVVSKKELKASDLQIKFLWGYNRADHTMAWLESREIISKSSGHIFRNVIKNGEEIQDLIRNIKINSMSFKPSGLDTEQPKAGDILSSEKFFIIRKGFFECFLKQVIKTERGESVKQEKIKKVSKMSEAYKFLVS